MKVQTNKNTKIYLYLYKYISYSKFMFVVMYVCT